MDRIAGMVITNETVALVVLAREGEGWRVENTETAALADFIAGGPNEETRGIPVILDATVWRQNAAHCRDEPTDANRLRAAGWDVRPPRWEGGRAANPSGAELFAAVQACGLVADELDRLCEAEAREVAFCLAAWGATHPTSAAPPVEHIDRGPGATHNEAGTCCLPALRSEDDPQPDDLAALARREAFARGPLPDYVFGAMPDLAPPHNCGVPGCRVVMAHNHAGVPHPEDVAEELRRQRDEAEAALMALCGPTGPCADDIQTARALLVRRGKMTEGR